MPPSPQTQTETIGDTSFPYTGRPPAKGRQYRQKYFQCMSYVHRLSHSGQQRKERGSHSKVDPEIRIAPSVAHPRITGKPQAIFQYHQNNHRNVEKTPVPFSPRLFAPVSKALQGTPEN